MTPTDPTETSRTIQAFVQWARAMGWRYVLQPLHLAHFARFLQARGVARLDQVDTALLLEYQQHLLASRGPLTVNGHICSLRAFWRWLLHEQLVDHDATEGVAHVRLHGFVPHLYSEKQLSAIDRAARNRIRHATSDARGFGAQTGLAAFILLRDCGLRVSEACHLKLRDYDPCERTLRIELTKFFKTRLIPLPRSTCAALDTYLERRRPWARRDGEPSSLFISPLGRSLGRGALESRIKQLLVDAGLYRGRRREGHTVFGSTNVHALRHTFAVRSLERWQREARDLEYLLPLLSAYMGHVKVTYTAHYLHLTPLLMQLASERFGKLALSQLDHHGCLSDDDA